MLPFLRLMVLAGTLGLLAFSGALLAQSQQYDGSDGSVYTIRYFAIPSTAIAREIAREYAITPSRSTGLLQVSVDRTSTDGTVKKVAAFVRGGVRDDQSESRSLEFQRVRVGEDLSNMAPFWFSAGKPYTFDLEIQADPNGSPFQLRFVQTLYGD